MRSENGNSDMEANLAKLCALSKDDKSENAMLRSRIDEQSRLIMILKQRADNEINKAKALERDNNKLTKSCDDLEEKLRQETNTSNMLDRRFHELASNHEEMIKIKDEYKRCNASLRQENALLKEENYNNFSSALHEKSQKLDEVTRTLTNLKIKYDDLETQHRQLKLSFEEQQFLHEVTLKDLNESYSTKIHSLNRSLETLQKRLTGANEDLEKFREMRSKEEADESERLQQLTKEKNEMLELAMKRGRLINKEQENHNVLKNKIEELQKTVKNMEERFERESAAVNVNQKVRQLSEQLQDRDQHLSQLSQKFEAYKVHTGSLLETERSLNKTLRHLAS